MSKATDGAFACAAENGHQPGITVREHFASMALQGLCASMTPQRMLDIASGLQGGSREATAARTLADALLVELAKSQTGADS